ncbi:phage tail assembly protein [Pseudomonas sp. HK3]
MINPNAKIPLDFAINNEAGHAINELSMRRPKVRDMITADKSAASEGEKEIAMFANLCEVTPDQIQDLDMKDYGKLQDAYQDFLS